MQLISNNSSVRNESIRALKYFKSKSFATQAKKGEQLIYMMPANKKTFDLLGDDIVEISTENETFQK